MLLFSLMRNCRAEDGLQAFFTLRSSRPWSSCAGCLDVDEECESCCFGAAVLAPLRRLQNLKLKANEGKILTCGIIAGLGHGEVEDYPETLHLVPGILNRIANAWSAPILWYYSRFLSEVQLQGK